MKPFIGILIGLSLGVGVFLGVPTLKHSPTLSANINTIANVFTGPQELIIPKLSIDTGIEWVGKDKQERMDVPHDVNDVAWYRLGPQPGAVGNAVIDGHLDSLTGPAIFYKLNDLVVGDTLQVITKNNKKLTFQVVNKAIYNDSNFPLTQIFGPASTRNLNLITCTGIFDRQSKEYNQRVVIYTQLIQEDQL